MPIALVTGASGGIGRELSLTLAENGYDLIVVARRADELDRLAEEIGSRFGREVRTITCDLSEPGAAERMCAGAGDVDVLVNNAGFGDYGPFAECDAAKQTRMIELNVRALTEITRAILPAMLSRGSGRILNVASVAAFEPGPLMSVYYATKAYVLSFSEAIQEELRGTGVTVTALCPGPTNTGFASAAGATGSNLFKEAAGADVKKVAAYGFRCMMHGKPVAVCGLSFKFLTFCVRLLPRGATRRMVHYIQGKTKN
ncbi:MAG: SDR family oxidoreductase [Candidatus Methanomethylophilaceae archaeon]|nr:SDR family oxidoreductase [Candidatus Methanomethylophilaceae archaeon]